MLLKFYRNRQTGQKIYYMVDDTIKNEYEKALQFLEVGCGCGCSAKLPKKEFAKLRENFQALTKPEQDIFLMAQLRSMDGGATNASRRLKEQESRQQENHLLLES